MQTKWQAFRFGPAAALRPGFLPGAPGLTLRPCLDEAKTLDWNWQPPTNHLFVLTPNYRFEQWTLLSAAMSPGVCYVIAKSVTHHAGHWRLRWMHSDPEMLEEGRTKKSARVNKMNRPYINVDISVKHVILRRPRNCLRKFGLWIRVKSQLYNMALMPFPNLGRRMWKVCERIESTSNSVLYGLEHASHSQPLSVVPPPPTQPWMPLWVKEITRTKTFKHRTWPRVTYHQAYAFHLCPACSLSLARSKIS